MNFLIDFNSTNFGVCRNQMRNFEMLSKIDKGSGSSEKMKSVASLKVIVRNH